MPTALLRLSPTIAERLERLNLVELCIQGPELVPYPLYRGPDVDSVAVFAISGNEADVVHAVVDLAIADK